MKRRLSAVERRIRCTKPCNAVFLPWDYEVYIFVPRLFSFLTSVRNVRTVTQKYVAVFLLIASCLRSVYVSRPSPVHWCVRIHDPIATECGGVRIARCIRVLRALPFHFH